jgi:tryptophanyl-tRNA synthetase
MDFVSNAGQNIATSMKKTRVLQQKTMKYFGVSSSRGLKSTSNILQRCFSTNSKEKQNIVFSGIQPTGRLHLGNYLGAVKNWIQMTQDPALKERIFCLVDLHAITNSKTSSTVNLKEEVAAKNVFSHGLNIVELTSTLIACGLDPKKCKIYVQSHVSHHCELMWILGCHINEGRLQRMHHYKEKKAKNNQHASVGLFIYPVLMCSDILLYATKPQEENLLIPVGDDQKQHLQLAQELAQQMNFKYSNELFSIPNALYTEIAARVMSLKDGKQKMSKSDANDNSRINMLDSPEEIVKKIRKAKTDEIIGITYDKEKRPEISNLVDIFASLSNQTREQVCQQYANATNFMFKNDLSELLVSKIGHVGDEARKLMNDKDYIESVLQEGAEYARERTESSLAHIRNVMGFYSPILKK